MLFYLLSQPGNCGREEILEALWPDLPPEKGSRAFHSTLYRLRRAADARLVLCAGDAYHLNPDATYWCDVQEFQGLLREAQKLPAGTPARAAKLQAALSLYQGPFLKGVYADWSETLRREIEGKYRSALASLAAYHAARKEYSEAIPLWR